MLATRGAARATYVSEPVRRETRLRASTHRSDEYGAGARLKGARVGPQTLRHTFAATCAYSGPGRLQG
jgi:integrase